MKRQIRQGVFETNSSSVHAICISLVDEPLRIPEKIEFSCDDFGWEYDKLTSITEKARYLYTCIPYLNDFDKIKGCFNFIYHTLRKAGVEDVYFEAYELTVSTWNEADVNLYIKPKDGYVDHGSETKEFVEAVCTDENKLLNYLFSNKSYIFTGNDNSGYQEKIEEDYPHEVYWKE